jgi:response regulator NasT
MITKNRMLRIAVAEDDPELRDYFRRAIPLLGHEVICVAKDGQELIERCRDNHPDVLITDFHMPGMNGIEVAERLSQDDPVPTILISGLPDTASLAASSVGRLACFLTKPVPLSELAAAIVQAAVI